MQPNLECNYEGTDLEQLIGGLIDQTLVLDSVYVEYFYSDSILTYLPGCPDPVYVETILERSYVIDDFSLDNYTESIEISGSIALLNFYRGLQLQFYPENGRYYFTMGDAEIASITNFPQQSVWQGQYWNSAVMPFPETWTLNEDGIIVNWYSLQWVAACQNFRLIPFWHEAE